MIIVDSMLGKLARYLRIMGYEVNYITPDKDDDFIVRNSGDSIVLTRDRELHSRLKNSILIKSYEPVEQLVELKDVLPKPDFNPWQLCPICSYRLEKVASRENLPEYVSKFAEDIFYCPRCDKYYWQGSHTSNFKKMMESIGLEI